MNNNECSVHNGPVTWLLGLSGAGKTTLAVLLKERLEARSIKAILLDGDDLRAGISYDLGFDNRDRLENIPGPRKWLRSFQQTIMGFKGHSSGINSVAFSPDGKTILTGSDDHIARLWEIPIPLKEFLKKGDLEPLTEAQKKEYGVK
ncbi:MAG: adenylyl-sulfate kinase [Ferruginibacter sp.]